MFSKALGFTSTADRRYSYGFTGFKVNSFLARKIRVFLRGVWGGQALWNNTQCFRNTMLSIATHFKLETAARSSSRAEASAHSTGTRGSLENVSTTTENEHLQQYLSQIKQLGQKKQASSSASRAKTSATEWCETCSATGRAFSDAVVNERKEIQSCHELKRKLKTQVARCGDLTTTIAILQLQLEKQLVLQQQQQLDAQVSQERQTVAQLRDRLLRLAEDDGQCQRGLSTATSSVAGIRQSQKDGEAVSKLLKNEMEVCRHQLESTQGSIQQQEVEMARGQVAAWEAESQLEEARHATAAQEAALSSSCADLDGRMERYKRLQEAYMRAQQERDRLTRTARLSSDVDERIETLEHTIALSERCHATSEKDKRQFESERDNLAAAVIATQKEQDRLQELCKGLLADRPDPDGPGGPSSMVQLVVLTPSSNVGIPKGANINVYAEF
ncbi:hypothetical protein CYMTET_36074 [Cymbomonas tetramitiformis]|uniref:Uncharacterized protein n=1 Tax=Cymbomonas tetramitiformis TaxID=36881 RepID=A0AAE0KMW0_9CHLO|nr:hypothetical protein CYMTET_36074 [Cymbomonas tetramitiformis]